MERWNSRLNRDGGRTSSGKVDAFKNALAAPDVKAKFALQGLYPVGTCGADFALIKNSYDNYGHMINEAGIKKE